jgi:tetratricopeptide (TPR) repeat protein
LTRGKLSEALRLASQIAVAAAKDGQQNAILGAAFDSAMVEAWFRGAKDAAIARVDAGLKRMPLDSIKPLDRPYIGLAQVYALAGRPDLARPMLAAFERTASTMSAEGAAAARHSILSAIALAEHRYLDAAHEAQAADIGQCTTCAIPVVAIAYDYAERPDSAIAAFTKYVESASIQNRFFTDGFFMAGAYKRLGELWEAKGDKVKAAGYYSKFIEMWKNADADLQPRVADARRRLARLTDAEGRR